MEKMGGSRIRSWYTGLVFGGGGGKGEIDPKKKETNKQRLIMLPSLAWGSALLRTMVYGAFFVGVMAPKVELDTGLGFRI